MQVKRPLAQVPHRWFCFSAGAILLITGLGKIWSGLGNAAILQRVDPIFNQRFDHLMLFVGLLELVIAGICFLRRSQMPTLILLAWFSTCLLLYRMSFWWIGWHRPCSCLGNLTDALHIRPQTADAAMKIILAYLLIGSYVILFRIWRQNWHTTRPMPPPETVI